MQSDDISTKSARGLLSLLGFRGVGPHAAERLASEFPTLGALRAAGEPELRRRVSATVVASLADGASWSDSLRRADVILEQAEKLRVGVLTVHDDDYPVLLRRIADRPLVLYVRGRLRSGPRHVACVGTREPSRFGEEVTRRIAGFLAEKGWSIVSGLAIGVDALAHQAALEAKGHTVAILANGLESVYPRKNAALAERILDAGGAVVSEQPFGAPAIPRNLIQRDRLQCGMSVATIPMQTDIIGGSMHTVRFTLLQGRRLFAPVPQGAHAAEPKSRGILALSQTIGAELATLLNAQGEFAAVLRDKFGSVPPAVALRSREDYDSLTRTLEEAATLNGLDVPRASRQPRLF